ncbi:MAG: glycosyltransferase family 2 protein [Vicinamibacteraceae bacterium]
MRVSIAIPVYNEEAVLPELLRRVSKVLDTLPGGPHEVVFVDDGSRDGTLALLRAAVEADPRIRAVVFSRNFGHQPAFGAGLAHAQGDVVVLMDGDLQDPPEAIPRLLEQHQAGYDVVYARRVRRKEGLRFRIAYALAYRLIGRLSDIALPLDAGDFALLSRRVVDAVNRLPERQRYLRGLRAWVGFKQIGIEVEREARWAGEAKYTLTDLSRLAVDGMLAFSVAPLRAAAFVGALSVIASVLFALYAVYVRLVQGHAPEGFTALLVAITFLGGVQLFFLGVVGEYVGRIFEETKGRPSYLVAQVLEHADGSVVRARVS